MHVVSDLVSERTHSSAALTVSWPVPYPYDMLWKPSGTSELSHLNRRTMLRAAGPTAAAVAGAAAFTGVGANAAETVLTGIFSSSGDARQEELAAEIETYLK